MNFWRLFCWYLLTSLAGLSSNARVSLDAPDVRRALERELLKHTVHYLRSKLLKCLRSTGINRAKRKTGVLAAGFLEHAVDMELMGHTKDYLMARVILCRAQEKRDYAAKAELEIVTSQATENLLSTILPLRINTSPRSDFLKAVETHTVADPLSPGNTSRKESTPPPGSDKHNLLQSNVLLPVPDSEIDTQKEKTFVINGRHVTCKQFSQSKEGMQFYCNDIWVDHKYRLPNFDMCLPRTKTSRIWRHLKHLEEGTFRVVDLEGFCQAIGDAAGINGYIADVRVSWDCGDSVMRVKWLRDDWAGQVMDNGFLHDLECTFNSY